MKKILGIEFGSTRIKAVLTDEKGKVIADGGFGWENSYLNGVWTYSLDEVLNGLKSAYSDLRKKYENEYKENLTDIDAIGISAMMHGYLAFDKDDNLLVPFRTWRNTITGTAADELSEAFGFNIPQRWSVAHYYQAVLNKEEHVGKVAYINTLAGYVHYKLTGKKVLGVGDASGMFPVDGKKYDEEKLSVFNGILKNHGIDVSFGDLLPEIMTAGEKAGRLTEEGAKLLDETGKLKAGALFCPPEGDAGTGMVATNSIKERTGNVSAGTSAFVMVVLEKSLSAYYKEIDVVTTPDGKPVAMVHVNNCTSEINEWAGVFKEVLNDFGVKAGGGEVLTYLFKKSAESDENTGKITAYNFLSGEHIVGVKNGSPLVMRKPDGNMNLSNFMQSQIYSALGTLAVGMEVLKAENVKVDGINGHGGFFKTDFIGQNAMSAALSCPVSVMENAGEGGAWGIALLALFTLSGGKSLSGFLDDYFSGVKKTTVCADEKEKNKFKNFMQRYKEGIIVEKIAGQPTLKGE